MASGGRPTSASRQSEADAPHISAAILESTSSLSTCLTEPGTDHEGHPASMAIAADKACYDHNIEYLLA